MRSFSSPTHVSQFVLGTTLHELPFRGCTFACISLPSEVRWVVGGTWQIGSSSLRPELPNGVRYQHRAFEQQLLLVFNHGFLHTKKTAHVSFDAHVIAESHCAPTCFSSVWCVPTQVQLPCDVDTATPRACVLDEHILPIIRTAPVVLS